ncbi:MAG: helix-turn-helix transcriptional regulator [Vulcanimicrobiota bacterium]
MKDCPDLTQLSPQEKVEFWKTNDPRDLKMLGDRLLAESLPHVESSTPREEVSKRAAESRQQLGWSLDKISETLGVNSEILIAWEEDRVKPPESLPLVLSRLGTAQPE